MKLYATTTSERASKGQGGNKSLDILIKAQELEGIPTRQNLFRINMEVANGKLTATLWDYSEGDEILLYPRHVSTPPKGKEQKGECKNKDTNGNACYDCESGNGITCGYTENC